RDRIVVLCGCGIRRVPIPERTNALTEETMQTQLDYPQSLTAKYQPQTLDKFIGLEKPKKMLAKFAANPYANSFLFVGPSGTGKTTMALALAKQLQAEVLHIQSQHCT